MSGEIGFDFALGEDERALVSLARRIFADLATPGRVAEVERSTDRVDGRLWSALAETGLLGLGITPRWGGSAEGPAGSAVELALLLQQQGAAVAPVPIWATLLLGAQPLQQYADDAVQERWLPGVVAGDVVLTGAYAGTDVGHGTAPARARLDGSRVLLDGWLASVPAAHLATRVLVPYRLDDAWWLALVDPAADGVQRERAITTDRGVHAHLGLTEAVAEASIRLSDAEFTDLLDRVRVGLCALQVGVVEGALRMTANHVSSRRQFGREVGTFQAVTQRIADLYIDTEALRWTTFQAAWLLGQGRPAHAEAVTAAWWAARSGHRGLHAALHLHGGIGNDLEYPLHRYFLWARQLGLMVGGTGSALAELGELVPVIVDTLAGPA